MTHPAKTGPSGQRIYRRPKPRVVPEYCDLPPTWRSNVDYDEESIFISIRNRYNDTEDTENTPHRAPPWERPIACPPPAFNISQTQVIHSFRSSAVNELLFLWGWEARATDSGEIYFIDHNKQRTTWQVRIPKTSYGCGLNELGRLTVWGSGTRRISGLASGWEYKWNGSSDGVLYIT
jgi:hypothetical protein